MYWTRYSHFRCGHVAKRCRYLNHQKNMCKTSDFIKPHSIVVKITSLKVSLVRSGIGSLFCCYRDQGNFVKCCKIAIRARGGKFLQLS